MKNTQVENDSENEFDVDEPDELQNNASDDDWTPEVTGRRQSSRLRGTPRPTLAEVSSSDEDDLSDEDEDEDDFDSEEESRKRRNRNQKRSRKPVKRARVTSTTNENSDSQQGDGDKSLNNSDSEPSCTVPNSKFGKEFSSGSFVVLKTDLDGDNDPPLWKIDGKALLQKYIPFEQEGKIYYKNTSVYSGWTVNNRNQYYAATVVFKQQNRKEHIIEFQKDLIKKDKPTKSAAPKSKTATIKTESPEEDDEEEEEAANENDEADENEEANENEETNENEKANENDVSPENEESEASKSANLEKAASGEESGAGEEESRDESSVKSDKEPAKEDPPAEEEPPAKED